MSPLLLFTDFIKDRDTAAEDLAKYRDCIESIEQHGWKGYRISEIKAGTDLRYRCNNLASYTWHCRDYVKKILEEHGVADVGKVVNDYIRKSRDIQIIAYLANAHKHCGIDDDRPNWATDIQPRLDKPYVIGQQLNFPLRLKPTMIMSGERVGAEFTGRAGIGDVSIPFTDWDWKVSSTVVDKDGKQIGDIASMCHRAFETWITILKDHGIQLPEYKN